MSFASDSSSDEDEELYSLCFLAPLGRPESTQVYQLENNKLDAFKTDDGVGCRLKWDHSETEIYVYARRFSNPGPNDHYSMWLTICPIQNGEVDFTLLNDLEGLMGKNPDHPLGIFPGSKMLQRRQNASTPENQE